MNINLSGKNLQSFPADQNPEKITLLNLNNNSLANIPPGIKNYTNLRLLHLQNNKLKYLPKEIGELNSLVTLILTNNALTKLPYTIANLKSLEALNLAGNSLSDIPHTICNMTRLKQLHLGNNEIKYLPEGIGHLDSMTHLIASHNKIESLPSSMGNLKNLQILDISNNRISRLPEEIANLTGLKTINLTGNNLPIPDNHAALSPQALIKHVLDNQSSPEPELGMSKIHIFRNMSDLPEFENEYRVKLNKSLAERNIEFVEIENADILCGDISMVFILVPFDLHPDRNLIFDIIGKCRENGCKHYILMHKLRHANGLINLGKGPEIEALRDKIKNEYGERIVNYKNPGDIADLVVDALKQHGPVVRFKSIVLKNIGHFENLKIDFDEDISCLIGRNGTGKTTILRSLALAAIGPGAAKIMPERAENLLKIEGLDENNALAVNEEGEIRLFYTIDGNPKENAVNFSQEQGVVYITDYGDYDLLSGSHNLKSLVIGFAQVRTERDPYVSDGILKGYSQAHVNDLIPLINNRDDQRLASFADWIANLYGEANKQMVEDKTKDKSRIGEYGLIEKIFEIISDLTDHEIRFLTVERFTPPRIIISTPDAPEGIPLNVASQGFKALMGWIGYFLKRLIEAHPLSKNDFTNENAIVIVDETDSYIHPLWQSTFLYRLKKIFPNTQFVVSTHSPLAIAGLNREQIVELGFDGNRVVAFQNKADTWALTYRDILYKFFDTPDPEPVKNIKMLEDELEKLGDGDDEKKQSILENMDRLKQSDLYKNELAQYEDALRKREKELETLISKVKAKLEK